MKSGRRVKLGVNIDHVATLRQARRERFPDPALAAREAELGGAEGITLHLREDRRHIQDSDLRRVRRATRLPMNLEMAMLPGIARIALRLRPEKICIVPERRAEVTTEGGLDVLSKAAALRKWIPRFSAKAIEVSLFIDPDPAQVRASAKAGARAVELHTGTYANARSAKKRRAELGRIRSAAALGRSLGLKIHAGHGLDYENVRSILAIPEIEELNIGFSIVSRALFTGLREAVSEMKRLLQSR